MKSIFRKIKFPSAPGGNLYHWKKADTSIEITADAIYVIKIRASAQNGEQNKTGDDDDLRVLLDGFEFGKAEVHEEKVSWHGFGTAAAWDGASLKGGNKTVFLFVQLTKGKHILSFKADGKPIIKEIELFQLDQKGNAIADAIFDFGEKAPGITTDRGGIPWKSFVFQSSFNTAPFRVKLIDITALCESSAQKGSSDGDNIKVYANGQIIMNPLAPTSFKYKHFFFSGDQLKGQRESLMISGEDFLFQDRDSSVELWYDETPELIRVKVEIEAGSKYTQNGNLDTIQSRLAELANLPAVLQINAYQLRNIMHQAREAATQYAYQKGFYRVDDKGVRHPLWLENEVDAFRHFVWNVLLTRKFDRKNAEIITTNHELFWAYAQNKKEFSRSSIMDMWNNKQGREYATQYPDRSPEELFEEALFEENIIRSPSEVLDQHQDILYTEYKKFL
ncbi:MAG: hypothetical protein Q8O95_00885 [bacterium]|nr:hypothetical protein [bacterium]